jgi:hypothetical protein
MGRGKLMVDTIRDLDRTLQERLNVAAASADQRADRAIANVSRFVFAVLVVLTGAATVFGFFQTRAARQAMESRVRYENQKRISDALQTAFLIKHLPVAPNLGLHATYVPATSEAQVGGDWYDAFELPDKRILFSIGDVAGHGLDAAVVMSRARQAIIAAALHENDPARVLERANAAILLQESRMVTAICGYIDPATLEIVYATAGHPPPILARPNLPSITLPYDGLPLGIIANATYRTFVATASDGAVMVLYTDGVIEHKRDLIQGTARLLEVTRLAIAEGRSRAGDPTPDFCRQRALRRRRDLDGSLPGTGRRGARRPDRRAAIQPARIGRHGSYRGCSRRETLRNSGSAGRRPRRPAARIPRAVLRRRGGRWRSIFGQRFSPMLAKAVPMPWVSRVG